MDLGGNHETIKVGKIEVAMTTVKVGKLQIATTNLRLSEFANYERHGNCYYNFEQVQKIDLLLKDTGFRIMTKKDIKYLTRLCSCWVERGEKGSDTAGRFFGKKAAEATIDNLNTKNCTFLPAAGFCNSDGHLGDWGRFAFYWSSTDCDNDYAYVLTFGMPSVSVGNGKNINHKEYCHTVRCIRYADDLVVRNNYLNFG